MRFPFVTAALIALLGSSVCADTIQVREAAVRERPSFLGRVVGQAAYGEQVVTIATRGPWTQVSRDGRVLGWIHNSALTRLTVIFRSGEETVESSVNTEELALAGKGFSSDVEAAYRTRHGDDGFKELDRMEGLGIPSRERRVFLKQGGLVPTDGGAR